MKRHALLIGIDNYQSIGITDLRFAVDDATGLARTLSGDGDHGFPAGNIRLLTNEEATKKAILEEVRALARSTKEEDVVLFFYAGHGCSEQSRSGDRDDKLRKFLAPWETDVKDLDRSALDFDDLASVLQKIHSRRFIQIFDCCYSGAIGGRTFQLPGVRQTPWPVGRAYLEKVAGLGRVVMTACTGQEVARELPEYGHGVFSHFLIEGLKGRADLRRDGLVDLDELWMFVQDATIEETGGAQNPVREGWIQGGSIGLSRSRTLEATDDAKLALSERILDKFGDYRIQDVRIAESAELSSIAAEAACYLDQQCLRSNQKVAVSCGRTLIETINQLPRQKHRGVEIYPLNGSPSEEVRLTDSMVLTYLLWSKFDAGRARAHVVPTGVPEELFPRVQEGIASLAASVLERAKSSDILLFGIGSPSASNKNIPYLLEKASLEADDLIAMGAVGEINFHIYNEDGRLLALDSGLADDERRAISDYNTKFFSLSARDLVEITTRSGVNLVVVAGGDSKRRAIMAAIRGGFVRTLVTDLRTADWLANVAER